MSDNELVVRFDKSESNPTIESLAKDVEYFDKVKGMSSALRELSANSPDEYFDKIKNISASLQPLSDESSLADRVAFIAQIDKLNKLIKDVRGSNISTLGYENFALPYNRATN